MVLGTPNRLVVFIFVYLEPFWVDSHFTVDREFFVADFRAENE